MDVVEKYGRAFFVEILAYGVPLKKGSYEIQELLEQLSTAISIEANLVVETIENRLRFYDHAGIPVVGLACEEEVDRLIFTMPGEEPSLEFASSILDVLFASVRTCIDLEVFGEIQPTVNHQTIRSDGTEESFDCDDDFSI